MSGGLLGLKTKLNRKRKNSWFIITAEVSPLFSFFRYLLPKTNLVLDHICIPVVFTFPNDMLNCGFDPESIHSMGLWSLYICSISQSFLMCLCYYNFQECCICISAYEDGNELRELPCHHHFHSMCIEKWLYINATCPLCKFNILKASNQIDSEEV